MTANAKLKNISDEFLINSDQIFDDCVEGLKNLDRIVVSVSSQIAPLARSYLIPIIYAYWERFFRTIFLEYLRCIEKAKIDLDEIHTDIVSLRFRKEFQKIAKEKEIPELYLIANKFNLSEMKEFSDNIGAKLIEPLAFPDNIDWVKTDSNVSAKVLDSTCKRLKVDYKRIQEDLIKQNYHIYPALKDLVDARNSVAHGGRFEFVEADDWDTHKIFTKELMMALQFVLFEHLSENQTILQ